MKNLDQIIVAHRGASYDAPENTKESVQLAWDKGALAAEVDVRLTRDNQVVLIHDADTLRTSGIKKLVAESTYDDLKDLDVGSFKSKKWKGARISKLAHILPSIPANCKLVVEIKSGVEIVDHIVQVINKVNLDEAQLEIISFNFEVICAMKQKLPKNKCLWLLDLDYYWWNWFMFISAKKIAKKTLAANLDGVDVYAGKMANSTFVKELQNYGLLVYVWTVNDPRVGKKYHEMDIDGITTDRPKWLKEQLNTVSSN